MSKKTLPESVIIVGAGASGLFAARKLRAMGVKKIALIEKEANVGGKCSSYHDPENGEVIAERVQLWSLPTMGGFGSIERGGY